MVFQPETQFPHWQTVTQTSATFWNAGRVGNSFRKDIDKSALLSQLISEFWVFVGIIFLQFNEWIGHILQSVPNIGIKYIIVLCHSFNKLQQTAASWKEFLWLLFEICLLFVRFKHSLGRQWRGLLSLWWPPNLEQ